MGTTYLLLASSHEPIARGVPERAPDADTVTLRVLDGAAAAVAQHDIILLVGPDGGQLPLQCHLLERREDRVILRKMMALDPRLRQEVRVPVRFDSFIYPLSGGRMSLQSIDLSGGGISFSSPGELAVGERAEVVVPITTNPIIVRMEILRRQRLHPERTYYAARFVELHQDEEQMLCEAVFGVQQKERPMLLTVREREDTRE